MTVQFRFILGTTLMLAWVSQPVRAQDDCGFSKYRFGQMSDWMQDAIIRKVKPEYPADVKTKGEGGTVHIHILVDKRGRVVRTCPLYLPGESKPDPALVAAAERAAKKWRFRPNFGQPAHIHFRTFDYIRDVLIFRFDPPKVRLVGAQRSCVADGGGMAAGSHDTVIVSWACTLEAQEEPTAQGRCRGYTLSRSKGRQVPD